MTRKRSKSSQRWLERQEKDLYTQKAKQTGYRSRSVYKLLEIQEKDHILKAGMCVVDLGAAPGGWTQVALQQVGQTGRVISVDILPIEPMPGADIIEGDFTEEKVLEQLMSTVNGQKVDVVLSDMAPNLSGIRVMDQARAMLLSELALEFAKGVLTPGGCFLVKLFQGTGAQEYVALLRQDFQKVVIRKPKASRAESREYYVLAKGFQNTAS